jgi:hypothetical protein
MKRLKDWPSRFAALVESVRARPFAWGSHDCCLWAAAAVQAVTGEDRAETWRGTYVDERGAARMALRLGGLPVIAADAGPEIPPALAVAADVGFVRWPDGTHSLAVCSGDAWLCVGEAGLVRLGLDSCLRAWGVGRV